ncbi:hypothetical protein CZP2022_220 [Vibrio phage C-ZP2022]|nr:hypothetical protein CZP2022_220 [Vibrio phage C-ZP2022]
MFDIAILVLMFTGIFGDLIYVRFLTERQRRLILRWNHEFVDLIRDLADASHRNDAYSHGRECALKLHKQFLDQYPDNLIPREMKSPQIAVRIFSREFNKLTNVPGVDNGDVL